MNIFPISTDNQENAAFLDDVRVLKVALDATKLLATAFEEVGGTPLYRQDINLILKPGNTQRELIDLIRGDLQAFMWTADYALSCFREHHKRSGQVRKEANFIIYMLGALKNQQLIPDSGVLQLPFNFDAIRADMESRWVRQERKPRWGGKYER